MMKMKQFKNKANNKKKGRNERKISKTLCIRSEPPIHDPRELETILTHSLRALFGDFECYSCTLKVQLHEATTPQTTPSPPSSIVDKDKFIINDEVELKNTKRRKTFVPVLEVVCPQESVRSVRAALTWLTLPPYMELSDDSTLYRLEIVD